MKEKLISIYSFITAIFISAFIWMTFKLSNISFFKHIAVSIFCIVIFDIIFTCLEWIISKLIEKCIEKRQKRIREKNELLEEMKGFLETRYFEEIKNTEIYVNGLRKLINSISMRGSKEKALKILNILNEIIIILKNNNEKYLDMAFLFEVQLPEFYNTLKRYDEFIKLKKVSKEENEENLKNIVSKFLETIENKKEELETKRYE